MNGFEPASAIEKFAAQEITWNGLAYRREAISRGPTSKNVGEKTNTVTLTFSNISRYMATLAQSQEMEGLFCVIRTVAPSVTSDTLVLFVGRCDKPSDIDKQTFTISVRQDFGNINQTVPPRRFENSDPDGRLPSDPLYKGIDLVGIGGSLTFPEVVPSTSFFGRLFGRRDTVYRTTQWSSLNSTPFGQVMPEMFGRVQVLLIPIAWADKGSHVGYLMVVGNGRLDAVTNLKTRTQGMSDPLCSFANPPAPAVIHLGDPGGTGTNNGNTCQADLAGGRFFSHTAYIEGASLGLDANGVPVALGLDVADSIPEVTALVRGKRIPLRNSSGVYGAAGWTDNPVDILRFMLTDPDWVGIDPAFMDDAAFHRVAQHCDEPIIDNTGDQIIVVQGPDINVAGTNFTRYRSTGIYTPRWFLYHRLGDTSIIPEFEDGPYIGVDIGDPPVDPSDPSDPAYLPQKPLIARYRANFPITEEVRAVDLIYKTLLPTFKGGIRVTKLGKYEPISEKPSDSTRLRTATAVGAASIPVLDVTPWKTGPELLKGWVHLGFGLTTSENRKPSAAEYSASGNSITIDIAKTGSVGVARSSTTLTGGSTTVPAQAFYTISGSPAAGDTVTVTIDGIALDPYIVQSGETTGTVAAMLTSYINGNQRLNKYIRATWDSASPTIVSLMCLHGALTVPALLKTHATKIADPTTAPTVAAAAGGSLPAGTYLVAYADTTAYGSTYLTAKASVVVTVNQKINVSSLPALVGTGRDFYMSEKAGSTNLRYVTSRTDATNFSISSVPLNGAALPPSQNTTAEELIRIAMPFATNSQDVYPVWPASTLLILNDIYLPTTANGHKYQVTTAGTTGTTEPTWPTTAGGTVASGSAVFTEIGSTVLEQSGLRRANVKKDSLKWPLGSRQSSVNVIEGDYRDAKTDFALTKFRVRDDVHYQQVKKWYPLKIDLTAVDNFNQMSRLANFNLSKNREGDWFVSLATGPAGLVLEEGDLISVSDDSGGLINVICRIEELRIDKDHDVTITQARRYSTQMFSDDVGSHRIPLASTLKFSKTKDSIATFIDSFSVREKDALADPGFYLTVTHDLDVQGDWRGYSVWADYGDGYVFITENDVAATTGTCTTTLATVTDPTVWDRTNSVTFTLDYADTVPFATVTEEELLFNSLRNLFLIGNEYVQAATITDLGSRSYTISTLLRGRFGTDNSQLTHSASERVVLMNGAEMLVPISPSRLNVPVDYKVVTTNEDLADVTAQSVTWLGGNKRCLSPVNFVGVRDASNNLFVSWQRRDRVGMFIKDLAGTPMSEEEEIYQVEVMNGASVVRGPVRIRTSQLQPFFYSRIVPYDPLAIETDSLYIGLQKVDITNTAIQGAVTLQPPIGGLAHGDGVGFIDNAVSEAGNISWSIWLELRPTSSTARALQVWTNGSLTYSQVITGLAPDNTPVELKVELINNRVECKATIGGRVEEVIYRSTINGAEFNTRDIRGMTINAGSSGILVLPQRAGFLYTAAQQTADGLTPGNPVTLRIGQESAIVGVGDKRTETV